MPRPPRQPRSPLVAAAAFTALATLATLAMLLAPAPVTAQELSGVALGPDGAPLAGVPVVLHRVGGGGGAFVATDTTGADGAFGFPVEADDSAIYFAALRYEDRMYIGPAVGSGGGGAYILRVEPGSEAGAVASALGARSAAGPAPQSPAPSPGTVRPEEVRSDAGALALVGLLALAAVATFLVAAPGYRRRRTREALIELARVENALVERDGPAGGEAGGEEGARGGADGDDGRARLRATRDRLRKQLAPEG